MYQPHSLQILARIAVNHNLRRWNASFSLPIPHSLAQDVRNHYLEDNIYNTKWKYTTDMKEVLSLYTFRTPFTFVSVDIFLTIMNWKPDIDNNPGCLSEYMYVVCIWYEIRSTNLNEIKAAKRMCEQCAHKIDKPTKIYKHWSYLRGYDVLDEVLQYARNWCELCYTTTLFYIHEHPYDGAMKRMWQQVLEDSSD